MNKDDFERALGSSLQLLGGIPRMAVHDYFAHYDQTAPAHSKRSRASLIHDHMIERAGRELPADFRRIDIHQRILFNYREELLIQFNKLDSDIRRASNNTSAQSLLLEETGELGLPGFVAVLPLVTVGYVEKAEGVGIDGAYAVRIVEGKPDWIVRLDDSGESGGNMITLPQPNAPKNPSSRIKRTHLDRADHRLPGSSQS